MQYIDVCVSAWPITFEWMNQSELHERWTEELASVSFVSIWSITDGAWLQWTSRRRFNVIFSFFPPLLFLSFSLSDFTLIVTLHCVHRMKYFFHSYYYVLMCIFVWRVVQSAFVSNRTSTKEEEENWCWISNAYTRMPSFLYSISFLTSISSSQSMSIECAGYLDFFPLLKLARLCRLYSSSNYSKIQGNLWKYVMVDY
jgi:hypothetical protein